MLEDQPPRNDVRPSEDIFGAALAPSGDPYSHEYWAEVRVLQERMSLQLFARMREYITHGDVRQRQLAADVLAQSRVPNKLLSEDCVHLLLETLKREESPRVLESLCHALGHHKSSDAVAPLSQLRGHPDPDVRFAIVHGLSCQDDPEAIAALISLSADSDRDVRNWATFGLGSMTEVDSGPLREALLARLAETDDEISGEALVGLALRGDPRVAGPLLRTMNSIHESHERFGSLIIDAVEAVRAASLNHPNEVWKPILDRCDELGLGKPVQ